MIYVFKRKQIELDVVRAFADGEEWAFSEVYERYRRPILKDIMMKVRDPEVAQELLQEVFLKVHRFRAQYSPEYALSTWLWTIARNTVLDWRKKVVPVGDPNALVEEVSCPRPGTESLMSAQMDRKRLRRFFSKLTAQQRRVIWLRVVHQLSYEEISVRLGLSLSAVKCLLHRAKRMMQELAVTPSFA